MAPRPSIVLDFIARNANLLRAAAQNERAMRRQRRVMSQAGRAAVNYAAGLASVVVGLTAAARGGASLVRSSLETARNFDTFAAATGVSVENLQQLEAAGSRVGLVFDDVGDVIQTFAESVGDARTQILQGERGTQVNALRLLGFSEQDILNAERDITGFFDQFFTRIRRQSQAQQQFILGEFSLPDAARRLLALPDSPLRVQVDIPTLSSGEIQRLTRLQQDLRQEELRFTRALSRFVVRNADSLDAFVGALGENTPAILSAGKTLAGAVASTASSLASFAKYLQETFGLQLNERTIIGGGVIVLFRRQIWQLISFLFGALVAAVGPAVLAALPAVGAAIATGLAFLPAALAGVVAVGLAALVDEVVLGGAGRRFAVDAIRGLFDWIGEQISALQDDTQATAPVAFDQPSQTASFARQPPPQVEANTQAINVLDEIIAERIRQIEDEISTLERNQQVAQAQGNQAEALRALERLKALLELQASTREQQRELQNIRDPEFIAEAHAQYLIGLRRQIAEIDQQIAAAGDPEAIQLRAQLQAKQRDLAALEAVPFDVQQFQSDRLIAIRRQVAEAEALSALQSDPGYIEAQTRLAQIQLADEGLNLDSQLANFTAFAAERRANADKRLQLAVMQAEEAVQLAGAQRALRLRERRAQLALEGVNLQEQRDNFDATAPGRLQNRRLRDQIATLQRAEDAQHRVNNLSMEYYDSAISSLGQLLTLSSSLGDVIRGLLRDLLSRTVDANINQLFSSAFASAVSGGGGGPGVAGGDGAFNTAAGGPNLVASKPVAGGNVYLSVDARGATDPQAVVDNINRALPNISRAVIEGQLATLATDPVQRDRFNQALNG